MAEDDPKAGDTSTATHGLSESPKPIMGEDASQIPGPTRFVLARELSEIHLMLDYMSSNPTKNFVNSTELAAYKLDENWIEQICRVTWPPDGGQIEQADEAALLIRAKNYLNTLAAPANGATIAFTLLVAQEDNASSDEPETWSTSRNPNAAPSRLSLARIAYPGLIEKARTFRSYFWYLGVGLLLWLALTCFVSWYAAVGNTLLGHAAAAQVRLVAARDKVAEAAAAVPTMQSGVVPPNGAAGTPIANAAPANATTSASRGGSASAATPSVAFCDRPLILTSEKDRVRYETPAQAALCPELWRAETDWAIAVDNIRRWVLRGVHTGETEYGKSVQEQRPPQGVGGRIGETEYGQSVIGVVGTSVLPVMYGILGAAAAVLRLLSRKMRCSLLYPRDFALALQQLALGAVIGACIGLFVASPDGKSDRLFGPVVLSGSALSFVAGFGVESVFAALEGMIRRLFNTGPTDADTRPSERI